MKNFVRNSPRGLPVENEEVKVGPQNDKLGEKLEQKEGESNNDLFNRILQRHSNILAHVKQKKTNFDSFKVGQVKRTTVIKRNIQPQNTQVQNEHKASTQKVILDKISSGKNPTVRSNNQSQSTLVNKSGATGTN